MSKTETIADRPVRQTASNNTYTAIVQPFLKWAGGKRQLLPKIREYLPQSFKLYFEPFVGAGAVLFDIQPHTALINDANTELVNCYETIKQQPEELISRALAHPITAKHFYKVRSQDRSPGLGSLSAVDRAARIIYLNKTCFNGLFRVNSQGYFNVPFGNYTEATIVNEAVIRAVSEYLNAANIEISNDDFEDALAGAACGDFIYLDPPYDPMSDTSSFTGYNLTTFGREEQRRLKSVCDDLDRRGCQLLLSNSATDFIRGLYQEDRYTVIEVAANRNINSVGAGRGKINELLIFNNYQFASS